MFDMSFYQNKKILITGHTGFKGTWMCKMLVQAGAKVSGYALQPSDEPNLYDLSGIDCEIDSHIGDIRDLDKLKAVFAKVQPEIVIHMAAQPLVRESYENPTYTYDVNVMGTVNVLECVRLNPCVKSFLNVTTDKVYHNKEWEWGYREDEELNGFDPYSNSKSCSELVTSSYKNSFFADGCTAISTARAGNVIGGGDFATDRIIPDCVRATLKGETILVRNPYSTRPYQHVLEPVIAYLMIAKAQYEDQEFAGSYNVGPDEADCYRTGQIVSLFCEKWKEQTGKELAWESGCKEGPHEANFLKLDNSKIKRIIGWKPRWSLLEAIKKTVEWTVDYEAGKDVATRMERQIEAYLCDET